MKVLPSLPNVIAMIVVLLSGFNRLQAQGNAFTYQGRLNSGDNPANGWFDLTFGLFSVASGAGQVGATQTNTAVAISNGVFTVTLDFGANFPGADRWLEIGVRTNSGGAFTMLAPRQKLSATPYAITASNLTGTLPAGQLSGTLASAQLGGNYGSAVAFNNAANSFSGNGSGLTNVNAVTLGGLSSANFWKLSGNGGTTAGLDFLGTTDNQPLELKVFGQRALRLEPTTNSPNVIGGSLNNFVAAGGVGNTIGGGGATEAPNRVAGVPQWNGETYLSGTAQYGVIGGGINNSIGNYANYSTISGGSGNLIDGEWAAIIVATNNTIGGGTGNKIKTDGNDGVGVASSTIGGGEMNTIAGGIGVTIGGGSGNWLAGTISSYSTISGGTNNGINASDGSSIGGGKVNRIIRKMNSTIGGGYGNTIGPDVNSVFFGGSAHTIGGGTSNTIGDWSTGSTVSGGVLNSIRGSGMNSSSYSTIAGGIGNTLGNSSDYSFIGGGRSNRISNQGGAGFATIGGGENNYIGDWKGTIGGGAGNYISFGTLATIAGGFGNSVGGVFKADSAAIGGGVGNIINGVFCDTIAGGLSNQVAGGRFNAIGGGLQHNIDAYAAVIAGGLSNQIAGGDFNAIGGGFQNEIDAYAAVIPGGLQARARNYGQMAHASGQFAAPGDAQTSVYVVRGTTTNATQTDLYLDGISQRIGVPTNSSWAFDILVIARSTNTTTGAYQIRGAIENNGGTVVIVGATTMQTIVTEVGPWTVNAYADDVTDSLVVKATGSAGNLVRWVATVRTTEVSN